MPRIDESEFTGVVHSADGVRFVATAPSATALSGQITGYIQNRCDDVLWPEDALELRALLASGNADAAIALYFERVGDRWDEERLELVRPLYAFSLASSFFTN